MLQRRIYCLKTFHESDHGLSGIPLSKPCQDVRVTDTEMTLDPIIQPGQTKNLNRSRAMGAISVAIKPPVEKHVSRLDLYAARKTGFYEGACQHDARITLQVTVAGRRGASRKCLEPRAN